MATPKWLDNNRIIEFKTSRQAFSIPSNTPCSVHYFASGREALFALISSLPNFNPTSKPTVLLPAFLPEGIIYPFKRSGWCIQFYNLDPLGNPLWEDFPEETAVTIAILIHLFGIPRDSQRFKALLSDKTIFIEDFAHNHIAPKGELNWIGDIALFSFPKLLGLPDGAALALKSNQGWSLKIGRKGSFLHLAYVCLRFNALLLDTIHNKSPFPIFKRLLKKIAVYNLVLSYRILQRYCHRPHQISRLSKYLLRHTDHQKIVEQRKSLFKIYTTQLSNSFINPTCRHSSLPLATIGYPLIVKDRSGFLNYLEQHQIRATVFRDGWDFIPKDQMPYFQSSQQLLHQHVLLPLHQKLSVSDIKRICKVINQFKAI